MRKQGFRERDGPRFAGQSGCQVRTVAIIENPEKKFWQCPLFPRVRYEILPAPIGKKCKLLPLFMKDAGDGFNLQNIAESPCLFWHRVFNRLKSEGQIKIEI